MNTHVITPQEVAEAAEQAYYDAMPQGPEYGDPTYIAWLENLREDFPVGEEMECYRCAREHTELPSETDGFGFRFVWRRCTALGPVVEQRRDPTQTYLLECGHGAI